MDEWEARMRKATTDPRLPPMVRADFLSALACVDALRKDAGRYRWLRDFGPTTVEFEHTTKECGLTIYVPCEWSEEPALDAAVDAAIVATPVFGAA